MIFPWQQIAWQQVLQLRAANRFPHTLLIHGQAGIGKSSFVREIVRRQLCQNVILCADVTSQQCHACRLLAGAVHPDVIWTTPEKSDQAIKIDQVRSLNEFIQQTPVENKARMVVINPANQLNRHAANALLKTLEEPPRDALLLLLATNINLLPATIRSRCQRIALATPSLEVASAWLSQAVKDSTIIPLLLQLAEGAPLTALAMHQENYIGQRETILTALSHLSASQLIEQAAKLKDQPPLFILDCLLSLSIDSVRLNLNAAATIQNKDRLQQLQQLATMPTQMLMLIDSFQRLRKELCRGIAINKQLVIENMLMRWAEVVPCF